MLHNRAAILEGCELTENAGQNHGIAEAVAPPTFNGARVDLLESFSRHGLLKASESDTIQVTLALAKPDVDEKVWPQPRGVGAELQRLARKLERFWQIHLEC